MACGICFGTFLVPYAVDAFYPYIKHVPALILVMALCVIFLAAIEMCIRDRITVCLGKGGQREMAESFARKNNVPIMDKPGEHLTVMFDSRGVSLTGYGLTYQMCIRDRYKTATFLEGGEHMISFRQFAFFLCFCYTFVRKERTAYEH